MIELLVFILLIILGITGKFYAVEKMHEKKHKEGV